MAKRENQISLEFVSNLKFTEFCALIFSYLRNILDILEDDFFKIEISLREMINNAIIHGNKSDTSKRVYVQFSWDRSCLRISIKDENTEKVDFDEINRKLDENDLLSFNGRGILISKSYMDRLEIVPSAKGTEIVMEKRL